VIKPLSKPVTLPNLTNIKSNLSKSGSNSCTIQTVDSEQEKLRKELENVKKEAEEYKAQLLLKEKEAEQYKKQLEMYKSKFQDC